LDEGTELYPDIALLERRPDFYSQSHPHPGDVRLVVEVADTTGEYDRRVKVPRYARAGVPEVWVVDLRARAIDVYRQPAGDEYRDERRAGPGESLAIPGVRDQRLAVDDVLA
jgi:Uma2 family endonuclease